MSMQQRGGDLLDPGERNSLPLLDGERMIGGLELDRRPDAAGSQVEMGLEAERWRINLDIVAEPAEAWLSRSASGMPNQ